LKSYDSVIGFIKGYSIIFRNVKGVIMERIIYRTLAACILCLLLFGLTANAYATHMGPPPVGQTLVREGNFAVKLASALDLKNTEDEVEAESLLAGAGIVPRNGWIADYPVTPDIMGEVRDSLFDAIDAGKLTKGTDETLKAFDDVCDELGISIRPYTEGETAEAPPSGAENYPNPAVIENYYAEQEPPVVTYYAPPPGYYSMYSWVPYPFWWVDFWFPGFFVLNDFHKVIIINKRVVIVTNHFHDRRAHRAFRIDPAERFRGRTFSGIGAPKRGKFLSTGEPRSSEKIFNRAPEHRTPDDRGRTGSQMKSGDRGGTGGQVKPGTRGGTGGQTKPGDHGDSGRKMRTDDVPAAPPPRSSGTPSSGINQRDMQRK
jgi:hypothetical protein